jgi:hypothetical protein
VFRRSQVGLVDLALQYGGYALFVGSLNTQEVGMTVQSIRTAVEIGNVAGDHLLVAACEMTLGEMDGVGKLYDLTQKVGTAPEALDDTWNLLPARTGAPVIVGTRGITGRFVIFDDTNLCFCVWR